MAQWLCELDDTFSHTHTQHSKASHGIKGLVSWQRETPLKRWTTAWRSKAVLSQQVQVLLRVWAFSRPEWRRRIILQNLASGALPMAFTFPQDVQLVSPHFTEGLLVFEVSYMVWTGDSWSLVHAVPPSHPWLSLGFHQGWSSRHSSSGCDLRWVLTGLLPVVSLTAAFLRGGIVSTMLNPQPGGAVCCL